MISRVSNPQVVPHDSAPLYEQVRHQIQMLVLGRPLSDKTPLPPESQLIESLGVSRGTLRRAIEDLVREGLLRTVQGSGTFVNPDERVRRVVWNRLREVARPDSRFDMNLQKFVPDFADRHLADITIQSLDAWGNANVVFIAPDNSTEALRLHALTEGKEVLVPTYGLARGFILLKGNLIK
ncbi:MAG: GntR family transcriptional regulator, partial [Ilumatobacteraceae bacterium]